MIGNDLVDLAVAAKESNWRRKGFLHKIFTEEEQLLILQSSTPHKMVWLLWSMKEAAYKIHSRKNGIRNFAPATLLCYPIELGSANAKGTIKIAGATYFSESTIDDEKIHTICATSPNIIKQIKVIITVPQNRPFLQEKLKKHQCISHHGAFLAQAFLEQDFQQSAG